MAIHEETSTASSVQEVARTHPTFINIAVQYLRPKQTAYIRETLQGVIREVINSEDLDLETDPCVVRISSKSKSVESYTDVLSDLSRHDGN